MTISVITTTLTDSEFIEKLDTIIGADSKEDGVKLVYEHFGQLVTNKEFIRANHIINTVIESNYPYWLLLPFCTLSGSVKRFTIMKSL